jgi:hypothetical protein
MLCRLIERCEGCNTIDTFCVSWYMLRTNDHSGHVSGDAAEKDRGMTLDKKKLAVIHIVVKELGLSEQEYRDRLEAITGVRSAKYLDERGFRRLMNYFARSRYYRANRDGLTFRQKMYIRSLKDRLHWEEPHFVNFLKKYHKKSDIDTFTRKEAANVIESLKNVLRHEKTKTGVKGEEQRPERAG